jgi:site-specific DNA recombinase
LDAQREAAEAYIASQRHEGWSLIPERFDDGGYTGANMDRPALAKLLSAVEARKVDCVVVYKVDRLSRSLLDFAKLMETFDRCGVSFVSVTQQFNTTSSLGRLTLNILLSFAQFERELISERTRDKMSAARKKGKWVGGHPVLGYDIDPNGGRLVVNTGEARQVKEIFDLYLRHHSLMPVVHELEQLGWRTKQWKTEAGRERGGKPFIKKSVYMLLTNPLYTGFVSHKGKLYEGEHEALVDEATWNLVQSNLHHNGHTNGGGNKNKYGALLRGLLFCTPCGAPMVHTYTAREPKLYRYYVCYNAQQKGWKSCETKSVSAPVIETAVLDSIRALGRDGKLRAQVVAGVEADDRSRRAQIEVEQEELRKKLQKLNGDLARQAADNKSDSAGRFDRIAGLRQEIEAVERKLAELAVNMKAAEEAAADPDDIQRTLERFEPVWESLTTREREKLIKTLVTKVGYDGRTGKVTIGFRHAQGRELCHGSTNNQ